VHEGMQYQFTTTSQLVSLHHSYMLVDSEFPSQKKSTHTCANCQWRTSIEIENGAFLCYFWFSLPGFIPNKGTN
jgi:hypothetical protein